MVTLVNRAKMTTPTVGTGPLTLGEPVDAFQSFAAAGVANGDVLRYVIEDGSAWEIGTGIYGAAGPTLTRSPSESSAGGAHISLAGSAVVFIAATSAELATNLSYAVAAASGIVNSSTGASATLPAATVSLAGLLTSADKAKLDGIAPGAQVNLPTNLSLTGGTIAGPIINSSTGSNVTLPAATGSASGVVTTGAQSFAGAKTFSAPITASLSGNATTATTLQTARNINGTAFNGAGDITTAHWGAARTLTIGDSAKPVNGDSNVAWSLAEIGAAASNATVTLTGNQTISGVKTFDTAIAITGTAKAAGRFYAGSTSPDNTTRANYDGNLHVTALTATGDVTAFSDARLKCDLTRISDALAKVNQLTGYTYTRIDSGARQTGLIAQDVQKVLPEAVADAGDHLAIAYGNMVGLLIEAVKELAERVRQLEAN